MADGCTQKWKYIISLDDTYLKGAVSFSEWTAFLVRDADIAYAHGANISCIALCMAAVEAYLKEAVGANKSMNLFSLIQTASLDDDLKIKLQGMRKIRNGWVHIQPSDDRSALESPCQYEQELDSDARQALRCMRRVLYSSPFV